MSHKKKYEDTWKTNRQWLIDLLKDKKYELSLEDVMRDFEYRSKKALIRDVMSVANTLKNQGITILVNPARCRDCGYRFRQRKKKLKIPSKCPKCKGERISWPSIKIDE
jgi:predicted Zn-ribbon and HTH transcriptional regulator